MYITRFNTLKGPCEEYFYNRLEDAVSHLDLFRDDDSGLYRSIVVVDDNDVVFKEIKF